MGLLLKLVTGGRIALDRPPQGTRAAPQVLVSLFALLWTGHRKVSAQRRRSWFSLFASCGQRPRFPIRVRIQACRNVPQKEKFKIPGWRTCKCYSAYILVQFITALRARIICLMKMHPGSGPAWQSSCEKCAVAQSIIMQYL